MSITISYQGKVVSSPQIERREMIAQEAQNMLEAGGTTDTGGLCPVKHRFADGCYCREILIPEGVKIIGKIHATEHFNTIVKGRCLVITTTEEKEIEAPYTWVTKAGEQKAVLALTDVIWQTYHVTNETDPELIVDMLTVDEWDDTKKLNEG